MCEANAMRCAANAVYRAACQMRLTDWTEAACVCMCVVYHSRYKFRTLTARLGYRRQQQCISREWIEMWDVENERSTGLAVSGLV